MMHVCFAVVVLGSMGIGGWLVVEGHPLFGLLVIMVGGTTSMKSD